MYYRLNTNNEIIEMVPGYFPGFHADLQSKIDAASDEQKRIYAIPESELVELAGEISGELFSESGIPRHIASDGNIVFNPAAVKDDAVRQVIRACDDAIRPLLAEYPEGEIASFPTKRALAYRWQGMTINEKTAALENKEFALLINESAPLPSIDATDELAGKIIANAEKFEIHSGFCLCIKKTILQAIADSSGDESDVAAILDSMVFPDAGV